MSTPLRPRDQLQREYRLNVLRLRMDSAKGDGLVVFTLSAGDGEELARLTASIDDIGLLPIQRLQLQGEAGLEDGRYRIPERIPVTLRRLLHDSGHGDEPLWLRLSAPRGFLATVPWERLLLPELGVPILRLPQHLICPHAPPAALDFILCLSSATLAPIDQARMVQDVLRHVPPALAASISFHIFTDSTVHPYLQNMNIPDVSGCPIHIYEPPEVIDETALPLAHIGENWWLLWMKSVLGATTADEILFLCDGYRIRDEGALVLPEPGRSKDTSGARLVFAAELVEFLEDVGAWSLTIASTPRNRSAAGLRMLHDRVAQQRPGPTVLHDLEHAADLEALQQTWAFLYLTPQPPPASPTLSLYCHPLWVADADFDPESRRQLEEYTLDGKLRGPLTATSPPVWLASVQRKLEASAAELAAAESANPDTGRKRAREFVVNAIAEQWQRVAGKSEGDKK